MDNIARIEFNGLEYCPENYNATPGALSALVGAARTARASGLSAEPLPDVVMRLRNASHVLLLVHRDNEAKHYVCYDPKENVVYEYLPSEETDTEIYRLQALEQLGKVTTMGRILVMTISGRLHYARLLDTGKYQYLGERPKPIWAEVKTQANVVRSSKEENLHVDLTDYYDKDAYEEVRENGSPYTPDIEKKAEACNSIFSIINYYHDKITDDGCFHSPFLIRFAYRMYDGSNVGFSAPILIVPNTLGKPELYLTRNGDRVYAAFLFASLGITSYNFLIDENWGGLITGIDVFATTPIYGYSDSNEAVGALRQDGKLPRAKCLSYVPYYTALLYGAELKKFTNSQYEYKSWVREDYRFAVGKNDYYILFAVIGDGSTQNDFKCTYGDAYGDELRQISREDVQIAYGINLPEKVKIYEHTPNEYQERKQLYETATGRDYGFSLSVCWKRAKSIDSTQMYKYTWSAEQTQDQLQTRIELKREDEKTIEDVIAETAGFYLLDELSMEDVVSSRKDDTTKAYAVAPKFKGNDLRILATKRQALATPLSDYQTPCEVRDLYAYNNRLHVVGDAVRYVGTPLVPYLNSQAATEAGIPYTGEAWEVLSDTLRRDYEDPRIAAVRNPYFFYTPLDAKQIVVKTAKGEVRTIQLSPHPMLGGSYAIDFNGLFEIKDVSDAPKPNETTRSTQSVYVSETDNPWVFNASGAFSAGGERVLRLTANTRALSEGQFGAFPLYAFTEGGVWALQPTAQGAYMSVQPISRDVCVNPDGITGLDTALVFPTARGLMLLEGASTQCLTDVLDGTTESLSRLPWAEDVLLDFGFDFAELEAVPLHSILRTAQISYDYTHSRIIIFTQGRQLALVYSLKTGLWCSINASGAYRAVPSYPEAYVQCKDGSIKDFTAAVPLAGDFPKASENRFYLVTRPFSLGQQDMHKTISAAMQRGNFTHGNVRCVLYGSQDLKTWHVVNSSTTHVLRGRSGTPYRHFRLLVFGRLNEGECLTGADFDYRIRLQNKLR